MGEALTADDRWECMSRALRMLGGQLPDVWETAHLARLGRALGRLPRAVALGLPVVATEQFHEAALVAFQTMLWWGTHHTGRPIAELAAASDRCPETARSLEGTRSADHVIDG